VQAPTAIRPKAHVTFTPRDLASIPAIGLERSLTIDKHEWEVRELIDPVSLSPTLVFLGASAARRVRSYPANWRELPDKELYALSWSRCREGC
jgi:hypothetical protein